MYIVTHRKLFFWITGLLLAAAVGALAFWGLPLGSDFTGGSLTTVSYPAGVPSKADIQAELASCSACASVRVRMATAELPLDWTATGPSESGASGKTGPSRWRC